MSRMSKELRANLIFLIILLVLIAPGFIILIRKKLAGSDQPNYMPDPVPHAAAFNQPPPVPPKVDRVEPTIVRAWVSNQVQERFDPKAALLRSADGTAPVMGDRYITQAAMISRSDAGNVRVALLVWDAAASVSKAPAKMSIVTPAGSMAADATDAFSVDVPKDVRHALQSVGFIDPPEKVLWVSGLFVTAPAGDVRSIALTLTGPESKSTTETITLRR